MKDYEDLMTYSQWEARRKRRRKTWLKRFIKANVQKLAGLALIALGVITTVYASYVHEDASCGLFMTFAGIAAYLEG